MANFVYTRAKTNLAKGLLNLHTGGDDIRVMLLMTDTTADTQEDVATISAFTTLDEMDGSGYTRQALANEVVNEDAANNRAEFDADNAEFGSVGAGTRSVAAALLYKHVTNDTDSIPIAYIDTVSSGPTFPFAGNGSTITLVWNAEGILQVT